MKIYSDLATSVVATPFEVEATKITKSEANVSNNIIKAEKANIPRINKSNRKFTVHKIVYIHYITVSPHNPMSTKSAEEVTSQ